MTNQPTTSNNGHVIPNSAFNDPPRWDPKMSPSRHSICIHVLLRSIPLPGQKHEFNYSNVTRISVQIIFHLIKLPPRITWIQPPTYLSSWIDDTIYVKHALFTVMEWKYLYPFLSLSLSLVGLPSIYPSIHPHPCSLVVACQHEWLSDWFPVAVHQNH